MTSKSESGGDVGVVDLSPFYGAEDDICPICLDTMPVDMGQGTWRLSYSCCGSFVCTDCADQINTRGQKLLDKMNALPPASPKIEGLRKELVQNNTCPMCRAPPIAEKDKFESTLKRAEKGVAWAQLHAAFCYINGRGVEENPREAARWFRSAAEQGHPTAMTKYGHCLEDGHGVKRSLSEALVWFQRSASVGDPEAQSYLGMLHFLGYGVEKDPEEAARLFQLAAEQGFDKAQNELGDCYLHGYGVAQDRQRALHWYTKAAEQGHAKAMFSAGLTLVERGVEKDPEEAVRLFQLAAEQGFDKAQNRLGDCYTNGDGVAQDLQQALHWYTKAAEQGHAEAMFGVGLTLLELAHEKHVSLFITGKSPLPRAMKWFRKAASLGHECAVRHVPGFEKLWSEECANCKKPKPENGALSKCKKCKLMRYCSKDCQVAHWHAGHKKDCCKQD